MRVRLLLRRLRRLWRCLDHEDEEEDEDVDEMDVDEMDVDASSSTNG